MTSPFFTTVQLNTIVANPANIVSLWASDGARFKAALGSSFSAEIDEHFKLAFCGLIAHELKPYGNSVAVTLNALLAETQLDCDNYAALTIRLFNILVPSPTTTWAIVGWNGGHIGNHAQIICRKAPDAQGNGGGDWLIDPTIAFFLCGHSYDWFVSGKPCFMMYAKSLRWRSDVCNALNTNVINALTLGKYRPSDALYYFTDIEKFCAAPPPADWPTPQARFISY